MDSARQFRLQDRSMEKPVGSSAGNGAASGLQEGMDCMQCVCVCVCVCTYYSPVFVGVVLLGGGKEVKTSK